MKPKVRLPRPTFVQTGDHPIYSTTTIDEYLPFADLIKSNEPLWAKIKAINLEYKKFPRIESTDMSEIYPDYDRTRIKAEALIASMTDELGSRGVSLDHLSVVEIWAFIHNHCLRLN